MGMETTCEICDQEITEEQQDRDEVELQRDPWTNEQVGYVHTGCAR